jgi:hypothetical protein
MQTLVLDRDAFSSGQLGSKLWMCQELERLDLPVDQVIWILGGWYSISAFLMLARERLPISSIRSFDIDPLATKHANMLMEYWVWQSWKFWAFTCDCNDLDYQSEQYGPPPTLVINTSVEHFDSMEWYHRIPSDALIVLQGNNMPHETHVQNYANLAEFVKNFPMKTCFYQGEKLFQYPSWQFTRYMMIGRKS